MSIGNNLFKFRKKIGLSQENVADKLGVSRQTISKWETDETLPDIYQAKKLAKLYNMSLDDLIEFDIEMARIEEIIENSDEEKENKIDWTSVWSKKYPILAKYQKEVNIDEYAGKISAMLAKLQSDYGFTYLDSMLVLKDILYHVYKANK